MGGEDDTDTGVLTMFRGRHGDDARRGIPPEAPAAPPPAETPLPTPADIIANPRPYLRTAGRYGGGQGESDAETPAAAKKADPLPRPGDAYRPHARFMGHLDSAPRLIHFVKADFSCEGFCYSDLRRLRWLPSADPGQGPVLVLRFVEAEITDVEVAGRRLEDVHHWISEGSLPWLWEKAPAVQVRDDSATVITRIAIRAAKARMSGE